MLDPKLLSEFSDLITAAKLRASSESDEKRQIKNIADPVLARVQEVAEVGEVMAPYVAIAFYGKLSFDDASAVQLIADDGHDGAAAIALLRAMDAVRIASSARAAFEQLEQSHPEILWTAVLLNFEKEEKHRNSSEGDAA